MTKQKPSIPQGTRDFLPIETLKRNYIFDSIRNIFQKYAYLPIETPAIEKLSTLMGKYGEEGDRLLFKILNSGDFLKKTTNDDLINKNLSKLTNQLCEKGLRYDLTVPFARFVVQHRNDINFPFKRYQIQPVWRADRPQKGRYREFYQCDVDVVGSNSLLNELELIQIISDVFTVLNINTITKLNNRKILSGIAEIIGESDKIVDITIAIDKLDKIGLDKVYEELRRKNISDDSIKLIEPIINLSGTNEQKIDCLREFLQDSDIGLSGVDEIETMLDYSKLFELNTEIEFDITLARGLNYYTGAIFEVKSKDYAIGSICGGGRYDDLTSVFGLKDVSGVGISFGADRIYDVMSNLDLFPKKSNSSTKLMFVNFGIKEEKHCLPLLAKIRSSGINSEIYPDKAKIKKQMIYANKKGIEYVAMVGEDEINESKIKLKNMNTGKQSLLSIDELILALTF